MDILLEHYELISKSVIEEKIIQLYSFVSNVCILCKYLLMYVLSRDQRTNNVALVLHAGDVCILFY